MVTKDKEAIIHLAKHDEFPEPLRNQLSACDDWGALADALSAAEETAAVKLTKELVGEVRENGLAYYVFNSLIWPRAPKFLYFDEYYQMTGRSNLNALIGREDSDDLEPSDYPLIGLPNLARLDYRELAAAKNTEELKNKLRGASNHLTNRIMKYWSQNKHVRIAFDARDAKAEDPEGMREGVNVWGEVEDTVHWASTSLGSRSRGFVWFFSFLAWYEDVKRQKNNVLLLLDEPGLSLHGKAQGDLLRYFESELSPHQMIYSTHSPFMIDPRRFDRVRIVQDLGIDSHDLLPKTKDGTKVVPDVFQANDDSLFPLQGALGYEIHQTLFVGPNSLIVEGVADVIFLQTMSGELQRDGREGLSEAWTITPVGGAGKVPTFVSLLGSQKGMTLATLLDFQKSDKAMVEGLYKSKILKKKNVLTIRGLRVG
ncbi:MAG TPA: AAA family ATPase [Paracoccaceae bacterium]|nr:AAA family ATPase [Paracoccaceae bacterium]